MLSKHSTDYRNSIQQKKFGNILSLLNEYVYTSIYVTQRMRDLTQILLPVVQAVLIEQEKNNQKQESETKEKEQTESTKKNYFSPAEVELLICLLETYQELQTLPADIQFIISNPEQYDEGKGRYLGEYKIFNEDGEMLCKSLYELDERDLDLLLKHIGLRYDNTEYLSRDDTNAAMLANCKWVTLNFDEIMALIAKIKSTPLLSLDDKDKLTLSTHYSIPMQRIMRIKELFANLCEKRPENEYAHKASENMQRICSKTNLWATFGEALNEDELQKCSKPSHLIKTIYWVDMVGHSFLEEYATFKEESEEKRVKKEKRNSTKMFSLLEKIDESIYKIVEIIGKENVYQEDVEGAKRHFIQLSVLLPSFFVAFNNESSAAEDEYEHIRLARVSAYIKDEFIKALQRNNLKIITDDISIIAKIVMNNLQERCIVGQEELKKEKELEKDMAEKEIHNGYGELDRVNEYLIKSNLNAMLKNKDEKFMRLDLGAVEMMIRVAMQGMKVAKNQEGTSNPSQASYFSLILFPLYRRGQSNSQDSTRAAEFHRLMQQESTLLGKVIVLKALLSSNKDIVVQQNIAKELGNLYGEVFSLRELKASVIKMIRLMIRSQIKEENEIKRESKAQAEFQRVNAKVDEIIQSVNEVDRLSEAASNKGQVRKNG